jgi:hypothetical protein
MAATFRGGGTPWVFLCSHGKEDVSAGARLGKASRMLKQSRLRRRPKMRQVLPRRFIEARPGSANSSLIRYIDLKLAVSPPRNPHTRESVLQARGSAIRGEPHRGRKSKRR